MSSVGPLQGVDSVSPVLLTRRLRLTLLSASRIAASSAAGDGMGDDGRLPWMAREIRDEQLRPTFRFHLMMMHRNRTRRRCHCHIIEHVSIGHQVGAQLGR